MNGESPSLLWIWTAFPISPPSFQIPRLQLINASFLLKPSSPLFLTPYASSLTLFRRLAALHHAAFPISPLTQPPAVPGSPVYMSAYIPPACSPSEQSQQRDIMSSGISLAWNWNDINSTVYAVYSVWLIPPPCPCTVLRQPPPFLAPPGTAVQRRVCHSTILVCTWR